MRGIMMCYGMFPFSTSTASFDTLRRSIEWRHPSNARVGKRPARQFLGVGDDTITLSGVTHAEIATLGRVSLEALEAMGNTGKAYLLIGGDMKIYGHYLLEHLETTRTEFFPDGTARKIEFSLSLTRSDDEADLVMSVLSSVANKVLSR